ncbi:MAG TPA: hypothetical protein VM123_14345 [archaeon]|nr:hypothetical protein [archaeon]
MPFDLEKVFSGATALIGTLASILAASIAWILYRYTKMQDMIRKRAEAKELQPKLMVNKISYGAYPASDDYKVEIELGNWGKTPAKNIEITIDGLNGKRVIEELGAQPSQNICTTQIVIHLQDDILQRPFKNPMVRIKFHDRWFPDVEYPVITIPFKQRESKAREYKYSIDFIRWKQDPPWYETAYTGYGDKQILEIWNREKLGKT